MELVKKTSGAMATRTKEIVEGQTAKMLEIIPSVVDQYKHDIDLAGKLMKHLDGDNLVNPSPVLKDARSINDFLKRVDNIKLLILKAAGIIAPVAANVRVQQVFSQSTVNILDPALVGALGNFLDLDDDEVCQNGHTVSNLTHPEDDANEDILEAEIAG